MQHFLCEQFTVNGNYKYFKCVLVFIILFIIPAVTPYNSSQQHVVEICPKDFVQISRKCYYFSQDAATFQDAYYNCLAKNSTLAVLSKPNQEKQVRTYLNKHKDILGYHERWIGATYDWVQTQWIWSASGKPVIFDAFYRMNPCKDWKWHCAIVDPNRNNLWYAKLCYEPAQYICQAKINNVALRDHNKWKKDLVSRCNKTGLSAEEAEWCTKLMKMNKQSPGKNPGMLMKKPPPKRKPRKIFICPSHMILLGNKCYYFSTNKLPLQEAHFFCLDNNTRIAVVRTKGQDKLLREFLNRNYIDHAETWIGGTYDWKTDKWKWLSTGKEIKYKGFAPHALQNKNLYWVGIIMDPQYSYQWNVKDLSEEKRFICQTKAKRIPYQGVVSNDPLPKYKLPVAERDKYKHNYI